MAKSPYHKATANDIDWVSKVKMQGAIQKWVDHSISVTVNLPNSVTEELVSGVSDRLGVRLRGVTVCRTGRVPSAGREEKTVRITAVQAAFETSVELTADIVRFKNSEENWIAFVGIYNDRP